MISGFSGDRRWEKQVSFEKRSKNVTMIEIFTHRPYWIFQDTVTLAISALFFWQVWVAINAIKK
ncbi:MAG: hypothetical protein WBG66_18235 [Geitlerinemataceae cyanobacterium]